MERIVIVCYRPKPGKREELRALMATHLDTLREQDLVSERESIMMEAADGTIVEVFGWASPAAIEAAHENPAVQAMWGRYAEVCEFVPIGAVAEAADLFSEFAALPGDAREAK